MRKLGEEGVDVSMGGEIVLEWLLLPALECRGWLTMPAAVLWHQLLTELHALQATLTSIALLPCLIHSQVFSHLKDLPAMAAHASLVSPTLIIIGFAVALSPFWPHPQPVTPPTAAATPADSLPVGSVGVDPRDRSLRDPDPLLPSQRERPQ